MFVVLVHTSCIAVQGGGVRYASGKYGMHRLGEAERERAYSSVIVMCQVFTLQDP